MTEMKVLSLFDGMACGMLAFKRSGIEVERYVAYEIDKYATKVSSHNFPEIEHRGDVFEADFTEFEGFDFVVGGSPCTYWSIAQRKDARETAAHGIGWELFQQYVRGVREAKPKYFIYENNKSMAAAIREEISNTFGFEPIMINSARVSAQNRERLYWVGVRQEDGTYRKADIEQPEDRGILLKDILESGENLTGGGKSYCLTTRCQGAIPDNTIQRGQHTMVAEPVNETEEGKAHTIKAQYYKNGTANFITNGGFDATGVAEPVAVDLQVVGRKRNEEGQWERSYEARVDGKSSAITSVESRRMVAEPVAKGLVIGGGTFKDGRKALTSDKGYCLLANPPSDMTPRVIESTPIRIGSMPKSNGEETTGQGRRVYSIEGKSTTLATKPEMLAVPTDKPQSKPLYEVKDGKITIKGKQYPIKLADGHYTIRKLTVTECKRLQTVPDDYDMSVISNTQAYKCLGNGWTVDVIVHLINGALDSSCL